MLALGLRERLALPLNDPISGLLFRSAWTAENLCILHLDIACDHTMSSDHNCLLRAYMLPLGTLSHVFA
jgi:hypothetical protein